MQRSNSTSQNRIISRNILKETFSNYYVFMSESELMIISLTCTRASYRSSALPSPTSPWTHSFPYQKFVVILRLLPHTSSNHLPTCILILYDETTTKPTLHILARQRLKRLRLAYHGILLLVQDVTGLSF